MMGKTRPTRERNTELVTPSNRDSIGSWLDVLTSMLSLPEGERLQVRDELEDHLRSRVDDLLITGTAEPEAVRVAVAELGETAELAKLITHAHVRAHPRRRTMNIALMTVAVAGLSIGGYSLNNTGGGAALGGQMGEQGSALIDASGVSPDVQKTHVFTAESKPLRSILKEISEAFGRRFELSRDAVSGELAPMIFSHTNSLDGEFTFEQGIEQILERFPEEMYGYTLTCTDTTVRLQSFDEYQRSLIETRVIPSPSWLGHHELFDFAGSLKNLLEVKHNLSRSSIEVVGGTIVVAAPPRIQDEVRILVAELNVVVQKQMEIRKRENQAAEDERVRRREFNRSKAVQQINAECIEIDQRLEKDKGMLNEILGGIEVLHQRIEQQTAHPHPDSPSLETLHDFVRARNAQVERLRYQISEDETRRSYLTNKRLESEYAHLFESMD